MLRRIARLYDNLDVIFESEFLPLSVELDVEDTDKYDAVMNDLY